MHTASSPKCHLCPVHFVL
ncbi:MAG: hypothetical protein KDI07_10710 [Anaerolineae bacterium]|nr:hypothetical protein [Anaerolineae bacterium]MCB9133580.1 hypothetical protein [Anaerolineales bacterium]MCB0227895.1 hypothetical protein [Anaerolineae bacterium]MCB0236442.1 hypothetical protein [Anaerolineae bacterium]MCB0239334.1 hypothetical protein [Anaerolineae bacterium]